jgi:hypothetical protein
MFGDSSARAGAALWAHLVSTGYTTLARRFTRGYIPSPYPGAKI